MNASDKTGAFWAWSLETYAKPGVAPTLLMYQDQEDLDVNLLLLGLWRAAAGKAISADIWSQAVGLSQTWTASVIAPIRTARRALKSAPLPPGLERGPLHERAQHLELDLEHVMQRLLEGLFSATPDELAAQPVQRADNRARPGTPSLYRQLAQGNLRGYFAALPIPDAKATQILTSEAWAGVVAAAAPRNP